MAKCKGCGEEIEDGVMFCPKCGVRQNSSATREENVDKIIANAATASEDVSSAVSDAYQLVRFGKKVGKAAVKEVTEKKEGCSLKSRVVAAVLAFFLGVIGAHSFYLGKKGNGVAHILMCVIGFLIGILSAAEVIPEEMLPLVVVIEVLNEAWALIESLVLLFGGGKDGNGLPVKNWT